MGGCLEEPPSKMIGFSKQSPTKATESTRKLVLQNHLMKRFASGFASRFASGFASGGGLLRGFASGLASPHPHIPSYLR